MNKFVFALFIVLALGFFVAGIVAQKNEKPSKILPTYGVKIEAGKVNGRDTVWESLHKVPEFDFVNQLGESTTEQDLEGKLYITDFFFTTCQGICPIMTSTMVEVYEHFEGNPNVAFLSHTVDPKHDTPEVLKAYADAHGASFPQWQFVTGEAQDIYSLARKGYLIDNEAEVSEEAFVHSQLIALVDPDKRIRGFYDGTAKDEAKIIIRDINLLLKEYGFEDNPL